MSNKFSIAFLVAAYNVEAYLEECLAAISQVVAESDEVIIVNDGSTDQSAEIAARWCEVAKQRGQTWQLINQKNAGVSAARRVAMHAATADYVLFADGDDQIVCETFIQARTALELQQPDVMVVDYFDWISQAPEALQRSKSRTYAPRKLLTDRSKNLTTYYNDAIPCLWSYVFRRQLLISQVQDILPEWSMFDDLASTPYLIAAAKSIWYEPLPMVKYRNNPIGLTKICSERSCINMATASVHAAGAIKHFSVDRAVTMAASRMILRKLRDNLRMVKRVQSSSRNLRIKIVNIYASYLAQTDVAFWGALSMLCTGRFGDVKALFAGFVFIAVLAPCYRIFNPQSVKKHKDGM